EKGPCQSGLDIVAHCTGGQHCEALQELFVIGHFISESAECFIYSSYLAAARLPCSTLLATIVSTSHALIPAQSGVWSERISADSEHLVSIELPDYSLYDTLVANISISDASASSRLVSPMDALAQNFSVSVGLLACAYWHVTGADWRLDGCRAVPANSSTSDVECRCDHLTAFAVLRLGAAFGAGGAAARLAGVERLWLESGVSIVPFAIAACALLLSVCLLKTTQWDSVHRRSPLTVVPLPDNCLATRSIDSYCGRIDRLRNQPRWKQQLYLISVETGLSRFAGTNARVYATLHGPAGQSDHVTRELRQPPSDSAAAVPGRLFGPGCRSLFLLSAPRGLVEPRRVRLWHDAAGGDSPSWLLRRVDVCRLDDSGEMGDSTATLDRGTFFAFPCNAWLSAGSASLRTDRELHVGNGNDSCRSTLVDWLQLAWPALHPWLAPKSLDYFPLHQDFIGGLPWAVGLRPDFLCDIFGQACLVSTNPMKHSSLRSRRSRLNSSRLRLTQ
uniref:GPS domain-containing protein n=1 Tax=Macrostomum lignano TaxID=282301 RepID=A0A1I8IIL3_9PLAT